MVRCPILRVQLESGDRDRLAVREVGEVVLANRGGKVALAVD
jgi:hypothetical protein